MSEEFGPDFISVTDEDGNEFELELIDTLEHEGVTYYAMLPAVEEDEETGEPVDVDADDEEFGLVIMKARKTARRSSPPRTRTRSWTPSIICLWSASSKKRRSNKQSTTYSSCSVRDGLF